MQNKQYGGKLIMKIRRFLRVRHPQPDIAFLAEKHVLKT
jgi:hypothetical protein